MKLFDPGAVVGVFRGFSASGMEFHADLVLPYRDELQSIPMHGQFVLVQLEHEDEAVLGRITSVSAEGRLEELAADAAAAAPGPTDVEAAYRAAAIDALRGRPEFARYLSSAEGLAWGRVQAWLAQAAPPEEVVGNRFEWARPVVLPALIAILGPQGSGWRTESRPRPDRPGSSQTWILRTETAKFPSQATPPEGSSA